MQRYAAMVKKNPPPLNVTRARQMRNNPTEAEKAMWRLLKEDFPAARFRRQVPIAKAIADFASHRTKLVIEIDGGQHNAEGDASRDRSIRAEGYRLIRFWNHEVLDEPSACAERIAGMLDSHPRPTAPSEQARKASYPSPIKGEESFIEALRGLATHPAARGLQDDAAVFELGSETLILTHDMLVEGVHVLPDTDPADIAWKLVAANMSDLNAKGAAEVGVLLGHMLGEGDERFLEGLREVLALYRIPLLGGDTVAAQGGPRCWSMTAIGHAVHTPVPSRSGARPGDRVWITGRVGGAMMGFEALRDGIGGDTRAYLRPVPETSEGRELAPDVTAMMDISDGLLLDASRIAEASGVTLSIDTAVVPIDAPEERRQDALRWGEDFVLLYTAPPSFEPTIPFTPIGTVLPRGDHPLLLDGQPPDPDDTLGYQHGT